MEIDDQTAKLMMISLAVNTVAAVAGMAAVYALGVVPGVVIFTVLVFLLPVAIQYSFLRRQINRNE